MKAILTYVVTITIVAALSTLGWNYHHERMSRLEGEKQRQEWKEAYLKEHSSDTQLVTP